MSLMQNPLARGIQAVRAEGASNRDVRDLIQDLAKAFADFKSEHSQQLEDVRKGNHDAIQALKVDRISSEVDRIQAAIDEVNVRMAAVQMGGATTGSDGLRDPEYSAAFEAHVRKGAVQAALNKGDDEEGGYLTPVEWDRTITDRLVEFSPMRRLAQVQRVSKAGYSKLFNMGGTSSGWVGETDPRPQTNTNPFKPLTFGHGEIYANPAATQQILDDSEINLEAWLSDEVQTEFARQEGIGFSSGDGNNKPFGILTYVEGNANAAKHPFGAIAQVSSGAANAITADAIIDIVYDLPSAFTGNARFTMNRRSLRDIRKLKDGQGNYLWQPSLVAGQPSTLAGFPVTEFADMPDIAANSIPMLFGDFRRTYLVIDRIGVRVLRDPFTNKPYVMFYTTKRVGGGVQNPEPMRAMRVGLAP